MTVITKLDQSASSDLISKCADWKELVPFTRELSRELPAAAPVPSVSTVRLEIPVLQDFFLCKYSAL
jgi:hypothetical protein